MLSSLYQEVHKDKNTDTVEPVSEVTCVRRWPRVRPLVREVPNDLVFISCEVLTVTVVTVSLYYVKLSLFVARAT